MSVLQRLWPGSARLRVLACAGRNRVLASVSYMPLANHAGLLAFEAQRCLICRDYDVLQLQQSSRRSLTQLTRCAAVLSQLALLGQVIRVVTARVSH